MRQKNESIQKKIYILSMHVIIILILNIYIIDHINSNATC